MINQNHGRNQNFLGLKGQITFSNISFHSFVLDLKKKGEKLKFQIRKGKIEFSFNIKTLSQL